MTAAYALVDGLRILREVVLDPAIWASWQASGNPKARSYLPIIEEPKPIFDPETQALSDSLSVDLDGLRARRRWSVRLKTPDEIRKVWTALEFLERFTPVELRRIEVGARSDETLASIYRSCLAAQEVASDDPRTIAGMGFLVALGLLSPARRDEILSGSPSPL
jgi:hypothetical protein